MGTRKRPSGRLIFFVGGETGVVGRENENGVLVPRLTSSGFEELAQCHVAIPHAFVQRSASLFRELLGVALRHLIWRMGRGGEDGRHEGLFHFAHLLGVELEERLVPNGPGAVELVFSAETWVGVKLCAAVVLAESRGAGKGLESHRTVLRTVEESRVISLAVQFACQSTQVVERSGREEKRFDKHGYRRQHRGHAIDTLASVGKRVFVGRTHPDERIEEGGHALVAPAVELRIEGAHKFLSEAFENDHHHILVSGGEGIARSVQRRIDGVKFVGGVVFRVDEGFFVAVRIIENGVFSTKAASAGRLTN